MNVYANASEKWLLVKIGYVMQYRRKNHTWRYIYAFRPSNVIYLILSNSFEILILFNLSNRNQYQVRCSVFYTLR